MDASHGSNSQVQCFGWIQISICLSCRILVELDVLIDLTSFRFKMPDIPMLVDGRSCLIFLDRFTILFIAVNIVCANVQYDFVRGLSDKGLCKITHIFHGASWKGSGNNVVLSAQFPALDVFRHRIAEDDY